MKTRSFIVLAVACTSAAFAQDQPPKCSVSGSVEDSVSHQPPIGAFNVALNPGNKSTESDANGNFQIKDVAPGTYHLSAWSQSRMSSRKVVTLTCSQDLSGVRLKIDPMGFIVGKVLDENGEPVTKGEVDLVARDYYLGKIRYVLASTTTANDKGEYSLTQIRPNYKYLVYAHQGESHHLDAISKVPTNPKLRKRVLEPQYLGGADRPDGAQTVMLQPAERKEGVDFKLRRTEAWCVDGVIRDGAAPAEALFFIGESQPHSGFSPSAEGALFKMNPSGKTGKDGKFRICELHRGDYSMTSVVLVSQDSGTAIPTMFSVTEVSITDQDIHALKISARPRIPISGEVVWDAPAPAQPLQGQIQLAIDPTNRPAWENENEWLYKTSPIPGQFSFPGLFIDEYYIRITGVPSDCYLKEATFSGTSMRSAPIVPGSGSNIMRIVLARDGGVIQVRVVDKDGHPIPDASLVIMPADAATPALLADSLIQASADQNGAYKSDKLAPGKYFVIAPDSNIDVSVDSIEKLWAVRNKAQTVGLAANGNSSVTVEITPLN